MSQVSWTKAWKMTGTGTSYCFLCMSTKEFWVGWAQWGTPMSCHPHKGTYLKHEPPNPIGANLLKRSHAHHWCIMMYHLDLFSSSCVFCPCLSCLSEDLSHSFGLPRDQLFRSFWPGPFGQLCCGRPQGFSLWRSANVNDVYDLQMGGKFTYLVYFLTICVVGLPRKSSNDICISSPIISLCLPLITPNFTVSVHQRMQLLVCVGKGFSGGLENHDYGGFYINICSPHHGTTDIGYRHQKKKRGIQLTPAIDIGKRL